jgi:hypothetical protein
MLRNIGIYRIACFYRSILVNISDATIEREKKARFSHEEVKGGFCEGDIYIRPIGLLVRTSGVASLRGNL